MLSKKQPRNLLTVQQSSARLSALVFGLFCVNLCFCMGTTAAAQPAESNLDWPGYGDGSNEQRFVPLTQINADNVQRLGLAWSVDLEGETFLEATPLELGGVLYFSGSFATVYAVEVGSGRILW